MLNGNRNTIKKNTEALLDASRKVCLEVHTEEKNDMIVSRHQNIGKNSNLLTSNKYCESVARLMCLVRRITI
jgi:hypothetical protein